MEFYAGAGFAVTITLLIGGVIYTLGSVVYARRWPNPNPAVFGYHELFHVFVIVAAGFHFASIWLLVT